MTENRYPRETKEFQFATMRVDGAVTTDDVEFSVQLSGNRPGEFAAAETLEGRTGVMVVGMNPGRWNVWGRVTSLPEVPVVLCGYFVVT